VTVRLEALDAIDLNAAADALRRGFADYFVPIPVDRAMLLEMLAHDGVAASLSRLILRDDKPVGCALIARRGWTSRLAGMAIIPEARAEGIGRSTMEALMAQARERGDRRMVLEVIEQNEPALKLYESLGFERVRRLISLERPAPQDADTGLAEAPDLLEIDIRDVAAVVSREGLDDLPWQLSAESLALSSPPMCARRLGPAYAVLSNPEVERIALLSLIVESEARGASQAVQLLRALFAAYPGRAWRVPALCPEEAAGPFLHAGFERGELSQWQMSLDLV